MRRKNVHIPLTNLYLLHHCGKSRIPGKAKVSGKKKKRGNRGEKSRRKKEKEIKEVLMNAHAKFLII